MVVQNTDGKIYMVPSLVANCAIKSQDCTIRKNVRHARFCDARLVKIFEIQGLFVLVILFHFLLLRTI